MRETARRLREDDRIEGVGMNAVDEDALRTYKQVLRADTDGEPVLRCRGFLSDGCLTRAGFLLFGKGAARTRPQNTIAVAVMGCRGCVLEEKRYREPIMETLPEAYAFIEGEPRAQEGCLATAAEGGMVRGAGERRRPGEP